MLFAVWVASHVAFNGDNMFNLALQFLGLAEKQGQTVPVMIGRRLMAVSLLSMGQIAEARVYYDQAMALYDAEKHRALATRFGQDIGIAIFSLRAWNSYGCLVILRRHSRIPSKQSRVLGPSGTLQL